MHIVIVGGGFAGVKTALELQNKAGFEVTLISKSADFEYHGALYRSATGHSPLEVVVRLGEIFKNAKNVECVIDEVTMLDAKIKTIKGGSGRQYQYDELVLAVGNEKNFFGIEGLEHFAHTMYTIHDTMELRRNLVELFRLPHRRNVRVIVVGAGPSGVEVAGDLQNFADKVAARYGHAPKHVEVELIDGAARVLPILSEETSAKAQHRLEKLGVTVMLNKKAAKCSQNSIRFEDMERAGDIIIWTAGSKAVGFYAAHPDLFQLERGKVVVDEFLRAKGQEHIYVVGDNAITRYSGMAQTAIHDAMTVAKNFMRQAKNQTPHPYVAKHPIYVVPIGGKWAVADMGKRVRSGRFGWAVRRKADMWIFKNFLPFKQAVKTWRRGEKLAQF